MTYEDALRDQLNSLRFDKYLREKISDVRTLITNQRGESVRGFTQAYNQVICEALHRLAVAHLQAYYDASFESSPGPAVVLLSYRSSIIGQTDSARRVTDWQPDSLSKSEQSVALAHHVYKTIDELWNKKLASVANFDLHSLAQKRISIPGFLDMRLPIYLSACQGATNWMADPSVEREGPVIYRKVAKQKQPIAFFMDLPLQSNNMQRIGRAVQEFVRDHRQTQFSVDNPYPKEELTQEQGDAYTAYLNQLMKFEGSENTVKPLCLCTIAISDELSNVALGTAMVFSTEAVDQQVAMGIHHICFDLLNALYKIEQEASLLRDLTFLVTAWVHHESKNWSKSVTRYVQGIRKHVKELSKEKSGNQAPPSAERLTKIADDLEAVAETAVISTQLLEQFSDTGSESLTKEMFEEKVKLLVRLKRDVEVKRNITAEGSIPRGVLLVCCELIRNADRHRAGKGEGKGKMIVELKQHQNTLRLTVTSEPHDLTEGLKKLKAVVLQDSFDVSGASATKSGLGGILIGRLAKVLNGTARWDWEPIPNDKIRVKAVFELNRDRP